MRSVVDHMCNKHGLYIPNKHLLLDLASFLGYLATQIRVWKECLYCGITRISASAIQDHMKDRGHCRLNFEKEPELLDFWEHDGALPGETASKLESAFHNRPRLASGKTATLKRCLQTPNQTRRARHPHDMHVVKPAEPGKMRYSGLRDHPKCQQLGRRSEQGIQNLSPQKRNMLLVAYKRSQKAKADATQAKEWTSGRKGNSQKYDQAYGPLSWAKGGLHNLLPR